MIILMLDMDGVLLESRGYHKALVETLRLVGQALGFQNATLAPEEIAAFEAAGITSEWESSAACVALMLLSLWQVDEEARLPADLLSPQRKFDGLELPDFGAFARSLSAPDLEHLLPLTKAEKKILDQANGLNPDQTKTIQNLIRNAASAQHSLTHRIFQELVLGSQTYAEIYPYHSMLNADSFLLKFDYPNLPPQVAAGLATWLTSGDRQAVIFTLRPSQPPPGIFCTREAELGAALCGLKGLPIAGLGGILWLAERRRLAPDNFGKPSPVHALTALRLALNDSLESALQAAASLALDNEIDAGWLALDQAQVYIFEDTVRGLTSLQLGRDLLRQKNIDFQVSAFGITANPSKRAALESAGATVYPALSPALLAAGIAD
jgi:hypothetical protein